MLYALVASGLSLIFGVMRVVNIAHGELLMLGGYIAFFLWSLVGVNPFLALLVAMAALFLLGAVTQRALVERVVGKPEMSSLLLMFGVSIILWNGAQYFFTPNLRGITYLEQPVRVLGGTFAGNSLVIFGIASLLGALLFLFLHFTPWGKAIRATSQSQDVAMACGIDVRRIRLLSFAIGSALAGAAGTLVAVNFTVYPAVGQEFILKAFAVVILGGLGSIHGAFVGGLLLGIAESVAIFYLTIQIAQVIAFAIIVGMLLLRPQGLFGSAPET